MHWAILHGGFPAHALEGECRIPLQREKERVPFIEATGTGSGSIRSDVYMRLTTTVHDPRRWRRSDPPP